MMQKEQRKMVQHQMKQASLKPRRTKRKSMMRAMQRSRMKTNGKMRIVEAVEAAAQLIGRASWLWLVKMDQSQLQLRKHSLKRQRARILGEKSSLTLAMTCPFLMLIHNLRRPCWQVPTSKKKRRKKKK